MTQTDVVVIGGGPSGSTLGTMIKKYRPELDVTILERETFPRDHVGESLLPAIMEILHEMDAWDKIEQAGFPLKVGATFKWGSRQDLWHTDFLIGEPFVDTVRPGKYAGQRTQTAFQVDRSIYDTILLDHAAEHGCRVLQGTAVKSVEFEGDRITGLKTENDTFVAKYYVDASGDAGLLRKAMCVEVEAPTALRNIAIWKYWLDAEWPVTLGDNATRIQVMSLDWGWMWFIPITPTRTSVGLVVPAEYFKASGLTTEQIYQKAVDEEPMISGLVSAATAEPGIAATKDWSFVADRLVGENWFLIGDTCGFADPILSAGLTLAHTSGRKVAFSISELERGERDPAWVKKQYDETHRAQIKNHIHFADFWYSSNGHFASLKEYCQEIAESAGITLDPAAAFQWLATGGFTMDTPGVAAAATYQFSALKGITASLSGGQVEWELAKSNVYKLDLAGAKKDSFPQYTDGRVHQISCLKKGKKILPILDVFRHLLNALHRNTDSIKVLEEAVNSMMREDQISIQRAPKLAIEGIEAMIFEGWITCSQNPERPNIKVNYR